MNDKWTWARERNQPVWPNGKFDSKIEAIKDGKAVLREENEKFELEDNEEFYVGRCQPYIPRSPDSLVIIDELAERMYRQFKLDKVNEYINDIEQSEINLLQRKLDRAWNEWLNETGNYPNMYSIVDIERVEIRNELTLEELDDREDLNINPDELSEKIDEYFNNVTKEELIEDLKEVGVKVVEK